MPSEKSAHTPLSQSRGRAQGKNTSGPLSISDVEALVPFLKSQGVRKFRMGRVEMEFSEHALRPAAPAKEPKTEEQIREEVRREFEADLFRSAGGG